MEKTPTIEHDIVPSVPLSVWIATMTLSIFGLAMPLVMLQVFDRIIPFQARETLLVLLLGLVVVVLLELAQKLLRSAIMNAQAVRYSASMSARTYDKILNADETGGTQELSKLHQLMLSPGRVRDNICGTGRLFVIELPMSAIGLFLIWMLAGPLVLVPVIGFLILFATAYGVRRLHRNKLSERQDADARRYLLFEQMIEHIGSVKANQFENGLNSRYRREQSKSAHASQAVYFSSNMFQSLAQSINLFFSAAIVCSGAYLVLQRQIGAAELAACTMLNGRVAQPLMSAVQQWTSGESFSIARRAVSEALSLPQTKQLPASKETINARGPKVVFDTVTLRATQSGRAVLRNFSCDCEAGFITLSSGSTGNASALFRCILGEVEPRYGTVTVNGFPARDLRRFRGKDGIVYVNGIPDAMEGTLISNIALCDDPKVVDRAYEVAARLGLEQDINKLPNGYDSDMRESGIMMASRGFLQRLNMVRALVHQPSILLLDDAICAMDSGMQILAAAALQDYARENLVIAYDSSLLLERFSDRTLSVEAPFRSEEPKQFSVPGSAQTCKPNEAA